MITKVYSIFDVKTDAFTTPFFAPANGAAMRSFKDLVNDKQSVPGRYPGDFKLVRIGEFDDVSGVLVPCTPESLGFGTDFVDVAESPVRRVS